MFDKLLRELKKMERGIQVPITIQTDDKGYLDRICPSEKCQSAFKVLLADWKDKVRDEAAYCPVCRHEAEATEFNTPEQREYLKRVARFHLQNVVQGALRDDARSFNSRQPRGGFIQMSLSYRPGAPIIAIPPNSADCLRQDFVCESCGCRYSSIGAAFFCPSCAHNSATTTFANAIETVRASVVSIDAIEEALRASAGDDAAANTSRHILENGLVKLVASFQRYAEARFQALPNAASFKVRKNLFQNLKESSDIWRSATGMGYDSLLDASELAELVTFFQQRHLLAHCEGMVDQKYIDKSGDTSYRVGQKLIVKRSAVHRLAQLLEKLSAGISQSEPAT